MKKSKKLISLLMVIITLFSIVSIIPASAASNNVFLYINRDSELSDMSYSTNGGLTYKKLSGTKLVIDAGDVVIFRANNRKCFVINCVDSAGKPLSMNGYELDPTATSTVSFVGVSKFDIKHIGTAIHLNFTTTGETLTKSGHNLLVVTANTFYNMFKAKLITENLFNTDSLKAICL